MDVAGGFIVEYGQGGQGGQECLESSLDLLMCGRYYYPATNTSICCPALMPLATAWLCSGGLRE